MTTITTPNGRKLGKRDPVESPFGEFKTYLAEAPMTPPPAAHWGGLVTAPWQMDGNGPDLSVTLPGIPTDWPGAGDCVKCGQAHALLTSNYDQSFQTDPVASANDVILAYCKEIGCTPAELAANPDQYD